MNMRITTLLTFAMLICTAITVQADNEEGRLGGLQIGMTKAQAENLHPGNQLTIGGVELTFDGRFGNFSRGGQEFEQGMTMYKLRPQSVTSQDECKQFKQSMMTAIEAQFGETQGEITPGEPTWQTDGLWISLSAHWYAEADRCAAEVFVRATDITQI